MPSVHIVILAILLPVVIGAWVDGRDAGADQQANAAAAPVVDTAPPAPSPAFPTRVTIKAPVMPGDSLARIFKRHGLPSRDLQALLDSGSHGRRLADIYPGHEIEFDQDADGNLLRLVYRPGRLETLVFRRVGDRFEGSATVTEPEAVVDHRHGVIEHSLFTTAQRIGLSDKFTANLAALFQWDIDFILDIRKGDEFSVLFEQHYVGDQPIDSGSTILAAEFVNQGNSHRVVRYINQAGAPGYYTPDGRDIRKRFVRAPVDFTRISSQYNMNRIHPLWKTTMPHRGVDYAAPPGTPVKAAGDGTVTVASKTAANGNYIVIQHGRHYQTKYLHLSRIARNIKKGTRVRQGQRIGEVGMTGWATGPHLHYEFLVDGVHKNPQTVTMPEVLAIAPEARPDFDAATQPLLAKLVSGKPDHEKRAVGVVLTDTGE